MQNALKREMRVAFSTRVQPAWFRVTKWVIFLGMARALFRTRLFWRWTLGLPLLGLILHLFYRWQTRGWTRPWGGWNDVPEAR